MKVASLFTLSLVLFVAACGDEPGPASPEPTGTIKGRVVLIQINGVPGDNSGARVSIDGYPNVADTTDANGDFEVKGIPIRTHDVTIAKPGFGSHHLFDLDFEYASEYQYGGFNLGEIPRATVSTLTTLVSGDAITFNGTVSELGLAERGQQVVLYLGVSDSVSNHPKDHSTRSFIDVDPGTRTFSYTIDADYFLSIGLAQGMRLHGVAHVVDRATTSRFNVAGYALDMMTSLSTPEKRLSFVIP